MNSNPTPPISDKASPLALKTDVELKMALAKMVPSLIEIDSWKCHVDDTVGHDFYWSLDYSVPNDVRGHLVNETEWLHVVWLIEKDVVKNNPSLFINYVKAIEPKKRQLFPIGTIMHASWQQRANAMLEALKQFRAEGGE